MNEHESVEYEAPEITVLGSVDEFTGGVDSSANDTGDS